MTKLGNNPKFQNPDLTKLKLETQLLYKNVATSKDPLIIFIINSMLYIIIIV